MERYYSRRARPENRFEAVKQFSIPKKAKKVKQSPFQKLQRLPVGCHPDFDHDHLCSINHLREFWYRSHGGVLVDDKERVTKTVLFTMSVWPEVCKPFLIVTPPPLSFWEDQFNNLAPFINVVVYDGGKDKLKLIQDLEFYDNRGCTMLQVLLSHPDAILEDIQPIARIGWEAIIVDCYQNSASTYLEELKKLSADFRLFLLSSPIKDNLSEYMKLLPFLTGEQENDNYVDTTDAFLMSETRFRGHIAYERQADPLKYLEHWVPANIARLQLETYCSVLLSNLSTLQSQTETDSVGAHRHIIISLSKCCDDPCLVGELNHKRTETIDARTETIDARVHSCGKLLLLENMLKEIRNNRLRVIVLFQSGGAAGNPIGDILEGVVHHRFGRESYERVEDSSAISSKKAAVDMFNDKSKGRFVFLIESRSCLSNIELSSIDAIIIYNSDWNPLNDLKALQRIKIESQFKYVSIFRLYTPFTMEEKRLVLAKEGIPITNIQDITCSLSHSLISWGPSFLFTALDELQQDNYASKSSERDTKLMYKVISEFVTRLLTNVEDNNKLNSASISRANMSGEDYSRNITLIGEKEIIPSLDGDPSKFWLHILDGKSPRRSYMSEPSQSSCRLLKNREEPANVPAEEAGEARRKRIKIDGNHAISSLAPQLLDDTEQNLGVKKLMGTPKKLHVKLKQELSEVIKVLQLPDNVRVMAEQFLHHMLQSHLVLSEPVGILHAFNIALSLALAEQFLRDECNEGLIAFMYGKLRVLKKMFPRRAGETSIKCLPTSVEGSKFSSQETSTDLRNGQVLQNQEMNLHGSLKNGAPQEGSSGAEQMISEPISAQAMQNEPVKTSVESAGGPTSDPVDFPESSIHCRSDGIGLPRAGCSSSVIPANDDSVGQESLTGECRNTEHVERDNIANPSMLLGGTISVVKGVSPSNDGTVYADQVCLELPILASSIPTRDDQPAEAEGAGILGAVAAQDLQPEMQTSTSMQDIPSESIPMHQSVEPSIDPHAGVESAHTSGVVRAHDLQAEIQPSVSMQDRPAEAGSDMLGTTSSAQGLQPEMRSSTTKQQVPHERTRSEERRHDGFLPNMAPRPGQPTQLSQVTTSVSKNPSMENELLDWLNHQHTLLSKNHEQKRSRLLEEYNQEIVKVFRKKEEIDKVNLKYGSLVLEEENTFLQGKKELDDIYRKVFLNQSVAENFPMMFTPSQGGVMEQQLDSSSATQTSVSPIISSVDILLPARPYVRPSLVVQQSSSQTIQPQPTIPSNLYGASTSSHFVPASVPHGSFVAQPRVVQPQPILPGNLYRTMSPPSMMTSYGSAGVQLRAPSPHFQQFGMRPPYVATLANQQYLSATGIMGATSQQAGGILTSMTPSSVHHHTISSASWLRPALPAASSLPYGRRESSMANILRSSSSNPTFMAATQQSSDPNIVLGSTTAPLNAAPGSQHAGARIAGGVNQPGSQSALPNAHLPARLGLTSSSAGTGQGPSTSHVPVRQQPPVMCLSDNSDSDEQ